MALLILLPIAILPVGVVYGLISAGILVARRRSAFRAARNEHAQHVREDAASWTALQRADRALTVVLLCIAIVGVALAIPIEIAAAQNYTFNNSTLRGNLIGLAGAIDGCLLLALLFAIPVAAVVTTKQIRRPELLADESHALATRTGNYRKIRISRAMWWVTYLTYFALGIAAVLAFVVWN